MRNSAVLIISMLMLSCGHDYTPKPSGYLRVDYPEKKYKVFNQDAPFTFEYPAYTIVRPSESGSAEPYWYNIYYPDFKGTIHLSYKPVDHNLDDYVEDTRTLVYKHASRSDGINEIPFSDTAQKRYGIIYELKGNVASAVQFFVTDSTRNFLRGSLYFMTAPNRDSLNPIINFVQEDIEHLIETISWK